MKNIFINSSEYLNILLEYQREYNFFDHLHSNIPIEKHIEELYNIDDFDQLFKPILEKLDFEENIKFVNRARTLNVCDGNNVPIALIKLYSIRTKNYFYCLDIVHNEDYLKSPLFRHSIENAGNFSYNRIQYELIKLRLGYDLDDYMKVDEDEIDEYYSFEFMLLYDGEFVVYYLDEDAEKMFDDDEEEEEEEDDFDDDDEIMDDDDDYEEGSTK